MKVLSWLRGKWGWFVFGATLLLASLGLRRVRKRLGEVRDELSLERARRRVVELEAERRVILALEARSEEKIASIDASIREARTAAVRAHEGGADLEGADLEHAYKELGF